MLTGPGPDRRFLPKAAGLAAVGVSFVLVLFAALLAPASAAEPRAPAAATPAAGGKSVVTISASTPQLPRKGEGDVIELNDGRLLVVSMEFGGTGDDDGGGWVKAANRLTLPKRDAMEPDVGQAGNGRVLMMMRCGVSGPRQNLAARPRHRG